MINHTPCFCALRGSRPGDGARAGNALLTVILLTLVGTVMSASTLAYVNTRVRSGSKALDMERAFYAAEAGAERGAVFISAIGHSSTTVNGTFASAAYAAKVECTQSSFSYNYDIISTGTANGVSRTVEVRRLHRVSWAQYSLWYDSENPAGLWMQPGDIFRGRVFSRPKMRFHDNNIATLGQVRFYDKAWSSANSIEKASSKVNPIFDKGLILNAAPEEVKAAEFDRLYTEANAVGLVLEGPTYVTIDGSGMRVTNAAKKWKNELVQGMNNRLVYIKTTSTRNKGTLTLAGPNGLKGQVTFVADDTINISNHVRYAQNPQSYPDSTDSMGLITRESVNVMTTAPNNLDIYAHVICLNGGFGVDKYNTGKHRGVLTVYGGIVNKVRNAVGTVGSPGTGYYKNYVYDERFNEVPPPYYPEREDLEWAAWDERP